MSGPRITLQVQLVLRALLSDPDVELYGLQLVEHTGLPPGTIYPIMARLEAAGWLASRWEDVDERAEGRPRRRYYRLTGPSARLNDTAPDGRTLAQRALAESDARQRSRRRLGDGLPLPGGAA